MGQSELWQQVFLAQAAPFFGRVPAAVLTLTATFLVVRMLKRVATSTLHLANLESTMRCLVLSIVGFLGWVVGAAATLNVLGLTQISLALGGSVALTTMAVATGLTSTAQDFLAGLFLLADRDFSVGRQVKVAGIKGQIIEISIRKTKLVDQVGLVHTIPNRLIDGSIYISYRYPTQKHIVKKGA